MRSVAMMSLLLVASPVLADTALPRGASPSAGPWKERCAARLERARQEEARSHTSFVNAKIVVHQVNGGQDSVALRMPTLGPRVEGFWIEVTDQTGHRWDERSMEGVDRWVPMVRKPPLDYPVLLRHVHPISARVQAEPWVPLTRWREFLVRWLPAVEDCLAQR